MTPSRYKSVTPCDFFKFYPYKKQIAHPPNTIPFPYVKKQDIVDDHKSSLDWFEWIKIVNMYLLILKEDLQEGKTVKFDGRLGLFQVKKLKCRKLLDRIKSKEMGKRVYVGKTEHDNYFFKLIWMRKNAKLFHGKWLWSVTLHSKVALEFYQKASEDYTFIYKFTDQ